MRDPLQACALCPRRCGVDRLAGATGYCGAGAVQRLFRHGPHFGEEPPLSGTRGSGALFFSHCTLACLYCQNYPWSQAHAGRDIPPGALGAIFRGLAAQGCHNWNLVSPTPWLPRIREAVTPLFRDGVRLPFVYNTSGFEAGETLAAYRDLMDIALTDLRYARPETAAAASGAADYVAVARAALAWFWRELGPLATDPRGIAVRGTICRILVLPGHADEAIENLEWIAATLDARMHVSVMSQYTPVHRALQGAPWNRRVTQDEYEQVVAAATRLGFVNGWIQPWEETAAAELLGCAMPAGEGVQGAPSRNEGEGI